MVDVNKERKEIVDILYSACCSTIRHINDNYKKVYAFILYAPEGFYNCSLVIKLSKVDLLDEYCYGICTDEWSDLDENNCNVFFDDVDKKLQHLNDRYYSYMDTHGEEPYDTNSFFEGVCIDVFNKLESAKLFDSNVFTEDLLKGLQFPDIGDTAVVKNISKAVNSPEWHKKVTIYCDNV